MQIVIIEDEPIAAKRLMRMISFIIDDPKFITLDSITSSVDFFSQPHDVDLVFMDIHLIDGLSFLIFESTTIAAPVIFTTAYDEYALKAFKVHALDYLLKPVKKEELTASIHRVQSLIDEPSSDDKVSSGAIPNSLKVLVKKGSQLIVLKLDAAAYYYTHNKLTFYISLEGDRYPLDFSLSQLELMLSSYRYFRINRQFLIQEGAITKMVHYSSNRIKLFLNPTSELDAIVSKDKVSEFRGWLIH